MQLLDTQMKFVGEVVLTEPLAADVEPAAHASVAHASANRQQLLNAKGAAMLLFDQSKQACELLSNSQPVRHPLAMTYSAALLKSRVVKLLVSLTEGLADARLLRLLSEQVSADVCNVRVRSIFLLQREVRRLEARRELSEARRGKSRPRQHRRGSISTILMGRESEHRGPLLLDELRQQLFNAPTAEWHQRFTEEGDMLLIFFSTLAYHSSGVKEALKPKVSKIGLRTVCEPLVSENFEAIVTAWSDMQHRVAQVEEEQLAESRRIRAAQHQRNNADRKDKKHRDKCVRDALVHGAGMLRLMGSSSAEKYADQAKQTHQNGATDISDKVLELGELCKGAFRQAVMLNAQQSFKKRLSSIEVVWRGDLHKLFFSTPQVVEYLSSEEEELVAADSSATAQGSTIDATTHLNKLEFFSAQAVALCDHVGLNAWLDSVHVPIIGRFLPEGPSVYDQLRSEDALEQISFAVALANAWLLLLSLEHGASSIVGGELSLAVEFREKWCQMLNRVLGGVQLLLSLVLLIMSILQRVPSVAVPRFHAFVQTHGEPTLGEPPTQLSRLAKAIPDIARRVVPRVIGVCIPGFMWYATHGQADNWLLWLAGWALIPLVLRAIHAHVGESPSMQSTLVFVVLDELLFDAHIVFNLVLVICAVLGQAHYEFFFAAHLLKAIVIFPALMNVVKAVTIPARTLGLTFALFIIVIYSFTLVGFYEFPQFTGHEVSCGSLVDCFFTMAHLGLIRGEGAVIDGNETLAYSTSPRQMGLAV